MVASNFQFNFMWEYAAEGLSVELRKVTYEESASSNKTVEGG
jgi:hypothetical protein